MNTRQSPPPLAAAILKKILNGNFSSSAMGDFNEQYDWICRERGNCVAWIWYWMQIFQILPPFLSSNIRWRFTLLKNNLKTALRILGKQKLFSFINIMGLAVGLTACMMIYMWIQDEISYDSFHRKGKRIFRVEQHYSQHEFSGKSAITSPGFGPALVREYPEIKKYTRFWKRTLPVRDTNNIFHQDLLVAADSDVFTMFDFHLEKGDPQTALTEPNTVVLTRERARKYLGIDDVMGKTISIKHGRTPKDFTITGIMAEVPGNSHMQFDILFSMSTYRGEKGFLEAFGGNFLYTFVLLEEGASVERLTEKLPAFVRKYKTADFKKLLGPHKNINDMLTLKLVPIGDIHLNPAESFEFEPQGSMASIYVFSSIAILILLIACINFINLSTARAAKRAKEIGMRKTLGAHRKQLVGQILTESVLTALFSLVIALFLFAISIRFFNTVTGKVMAWHQLFQHQNWIMLLGIVSATGLISGLFPAIFLAAFKPINVLKKTSTRTAGISGLRKGMAVIQFVISISLIIGTLIIFKQISFIRNKPLGFHKENVMVIRGGGNVIRDGIESFRNQLQQYPQITSVAVSSSIPGSVMFSDTRFTRNDNNKTFGLIYTTVDYDFIDTYGLEILHGSKFSKSFGTHKQGVIILNEAAAAKIGYSPAEAIGKKLSNNEIVGVVRNFHFKSLHNKIQPLLLILYPRFTQEISVRLAGHETAQTIGFIKKTWETTYPGRLFQFKFVDEQVNMHYQSDQRTGTLVTIFSILSIFVACLGLFGLAAFALEERKREIGIRKVLGARISTLVFSLGWEFSIWILAANILAWPLAYFLMNRWLQNFAYRISIHVDVFVISALAAFIIAAATVSCQSVRAASVNPVETLRNE